MNSQHLLYSIIAVILTTGIATGQGTGTPEKTQQKRRYSIVSGDDDQQFKIDEFSGKITVQKNRIATSLNSKTVIVEETVSEPVGGDIAADAFSKHAEQLGFPNLHRETVRRIEVEVRIKQTIASTPHRPRAVPMPSPLVPFHTFGAPVAVNVLDQIIDHPLEPTFAADSPQPTPMVVSTPTIASEIKPTLADVPMTITPRKTAPSPPSPSPPSPPSLSPPSSLAKSETMASTPGPLAAPATKNDKPASFAYIDPIATFVVLAGLLFILWKTLSPIAALNRFLKLFNRHHCTYSMDSAMGASNASLGMPNGDLSDSFEEIDLNADGFELAAKANRSMYDSIENLELVHAELSSLNWDSIGANPFDTGRVTTLAVKEEKETEQFTQVDTRSAVDLAQAISDRDELLKQTSEFRLVANGSARSAIRKNRVKDTPKELVGGIGLLLANVGSAYYAWTLTGWASAGMTLCAIGISIVGVRSLRKTFDGLMWYFASGTDAK